MAQNHRLGFDDGNTDGQVELAEVPRVPDHFQPELPENGPATMTGIVLERSRRLCLQQYQKELFTPTTYLDAYARSQGRFTREQLAVFAGARLASCQSLSLAQKHAFLYYLYTIQGFWEVNSHKVIGRM